MAGMEWLLGLALATAPPSAFPCDRLGPGLLEIYDGFEAGPDAAPTAVEVRKKTVLLDRAVALTTRTFTPADAARAGSKVLVFRRYRDGGATILCTSMRSDSLFGAGDETTHFMLRCLGDRDGDGRYDGFERRIRLVRFRLDKPIPPSPGPDIPEWLPFAQPLELVERPGLVEATIRFRPRARSRIIVSRLRGDEVGLRFAGRIDMMPDSAPAWATGNMGLAAAETIVSVPMTDAATVPIGGTRIRFAKSRGKWTATLLDGFGSEPRLHCGGTVAEVGDTFTILGAGSQAVIARSSLPPAR